MTVFKCYVCGKILSAFDYDKGKGRCSRCILADKEVEEMENIVTCAGCGNEFDINDNEQDHNGSPYGEETCIDCYHGEGDENIKEVEG